MHRKPLLLLTGTAVLALLLVSPFFAARRDGVPVTHDLHQHLSVLQQLDAAMRTGHLYPRWQPEFNKGYGLPFLNYYPPVFYWLAEIFHVATGSPLAAMHIVSLLMMIASGAATYALARQFFPPAASAGAAAFAMIAPYHNLDLYWRGALPELAGFFFVPLILLLAYRAGRTGGLRWIAALAFVHGVYLMTHIPVAYLLTLTLGVYAVIWAAMERSVRIVLRILGGVAWALVASAVYWLVAVLESKHVRDTFSIDYPYHSSYIVLAQGDDFVKMLNASFVALAVALFGALLVAAGQTDAQKRIFRILGIATIFMVTPYSMYIARLIPKINSVSFAWRWLVIATVFAALAVAMAIERLRTTRRAYAVVFLAALALNGVTTVRLIVRALDKPDNTIPVSYVETGFVPGRAGDPFALPDHAPRARLIPPGGVDIVKWEPLRRELVVTAAENSELHLRTYRFRGWTAYVDGRRADIAIDEHGAQVLRLTPGRHRIIVAYEDPRTRNILAIVSALAFLAALGAYAFSR